MRLRLALLCATFVALASALAVSALADRPARTAQEEECIENPLGPMDQFTLIIHGDLIQDEDGGTDSEGRIAVGGDARLRNFGVATRWPEEPTRVDLAVGGDVTATNVNAARGSVTHGGTLTGNITVANNGGTITQAPLDLDAAFNEAQRRSEYWAGTPTNGGITGPQDEGAVPDRRRRHAQRVQALGDPAPVGARDPAARAVRLLDAHHRDAASRTARPRSRTTRWRSGTGPRTASTVTTASGPEVEHIRRALLWNFPEATDIQIGPNLAWQGSVLAPGAAIVFPGSTQLNGTVVAGSLVGRGEIAPASAG